MSTTIDAAAGEALRDAGIARVAAKHPALARRIKRAWVRLLLENPRVNADMVRGVVDLEGEADPRVFGDAPLSLSRAGIAANTDDFSRSVRPEAHRRPIPWWTLNDRAKALAWLEANPPIPDPAPEPPPATKPVSDAGTQATLFAADAEPNPYRRIGGAA
jgi:hypothetical protein